MQHDDFIAVSQSQVANPIWIQSRTLVIIPRCTFYTSDAFLQTNQRCQQVSLCCIRVVPQKHTEGTGINLLHSAHLSKIQYGFITRQYARVTECSINNWVRGKQTFCPIMANIFRMASGNTCVRS